MSTALPPKLRTSTLSILTDLGFVKKIMSLQNVVGRDMQGGVGVSDGAGGARRREGQNISIASDAGHHGGLVVTRASEGGFLDYTLTG